MVKRSKSYTKMMKKQQAEVKDKKNMEPYMIDDDENEENIIEVR